MSTNLNYKQVANVARRTWDVEAYEQRAKDREKNAKSSKKKKSTVSLEAEAGDKRPMIDEEESTREEFIPAVKGAAGPVASKRAFLKARRNKVDVDSKIGSVEIVNPEAAATTKAIAGEVGSPKDGITKTGIGWHCKVCDCFLKDSLTYLGHINGKKHQRNLGYSMRVERSTKDQVSSRLAMLAKEKESTSSLLDSVEEESFYDIVKSKDEEAKRRKEERARKRKERKLKKKQEQREPIKEEENIEEENAEAEEVEEGGIDPSLAAMMGFSGFGGGNKNR